MANVKIVKVLEDSHSVRILYVKMDTLEERLETKAKVEIRISDWIVVAFNSKSSRRKVCIRRNILLPCLNTHRQSVSI